MSVRRITRGLVCGAVIVSPLAVALPAWADGPGALQLAINQTLRDNPGAKQISRHSVAFKGGRAIATLPAPGARRAPADRAAISAYTASAVVDDWYGCPEGRLDANKWFCFYQNTDFGGIRWQFKDTYLQNAYSFVVAGKSLSNRASSWVNTKHYWKIKTYGGTNRTGGFLWWGTPLTADGWVGQNKNDDMESFEAVHVG